MNLYVFSEERFQMYLQASKGYKAKIEPLQNKNCFGYGQVDIRPDRCTILYSDDKTSNDVTLMISGNERLREGNNAFITHYLTLRHNNIPESVSNARTVEEQRDAFKAFLNNINFKGADSQECAQKNPARYEAIQIFKRNLPAILENLERAEIRPYKDAKNNKATLCVNENSPPFDKEYESFNSPDGKFLHGRCFINDNFDVSSRY